MAAEDGAECPFTQPELPSLCWGQEGAAGQPSQNQLSSEHLQYVKRNTCAWTQQGRGCRLSHTQLPPPPPVHGKPSGSAYSWQVSAQDPALAQLHTHHTALMSYWHPHNPSPWVTPWVQKH